MKVIAQRIWSEPAAAIGLLVSLALLAVALIDGSDWTVEVVLGIIAPLASALGIRQLVTPVSKVDEILEQVSMKTPAQPLPPP